MNRQRIILDVDTGHDDAIAIMMAARNPAIELLGITVTAGNQILPKTLLNTLNLCQALAIDVPVYAGASRPLLEELKPAVLIHGESGFDGPVFGPCTKKAEKTHAAQYLAETVMASGPGEITLVAVGPLTNVALALRLEPAIAARLGGIVLMGGSMGQGNVTPSAEFNIHADPEAASIVFSSGARIVMIGLDVTQTVELDAERLACLRKIPGPAARIFAASMDCYRAACMQYTGESPAMHDPCCVAWVADPALFTWAEYRVDIELTGALTRGRTVVDATGVSGKAANATVALSVNEARFWAMLETALRSYQSPE